METVISVDVGGTNIDVMATRIDGQVLDRTSVQTDGDSYDASILRLVEAITAVSGNHRIVRIGVGVAGNVADGQIIGSGNLQGWHHRPLAQDLTDVLNAPATLLNDVEAGAYGEAIHRGDNFVYFGWGTGVGIALCMRVNGQTAVLPTEAGHMNINPTSMRLCGCGDYGHLEAFIGGKCLSQRFDTDAARLTDREWSIVLRDVAHGIYNLAVTFLGWPIVFGGGISMKQLSANGRLAELTRLLDDHIHSVGVLTEAPQLHVATLGADSNLHGAAYRARAIQLA